MFGVFGVKVDDYSSQSVKRATMKDRRTSVSLVGSNIIEERRVLTIFFTPDPNSAVLGIVSCIRNWSAKQTRA